VPGPGDQPAENQVEERNAGIQSDFDQNRPEEVLDRTISSPDKKRVLALYHHTNDAAAEFRLDMYLPEGKLLQKVTPDTMAAHFPDSIRWAPDSKSAAFVGMIRVAGTETNPTPPPSVPRIDNNGIQPPEADNSNTSPTIAPTATPAPPAAVLMFRTEQIYLCDLDGGALKPITQSEGKIYFYYVWSPDSSMLAALAATTPEWNAMQLQSDQKKLVFVPAGRPRVVEKNGRERLLDDAMTQVHPVWSPDSTKVAAAYDTAVRVYDASSTSATQAQIPLRNQLLISSEAYDRQLEQQAATDNTVANSAANNGPATTTLPDPSKLVSFNPIVMLNWNADDILYLQTGYVRQFQNAADSRSSYLRWHRLILSPQPTK
jgi:hypothetical protein